MMAINLRPLCIDSSDLTLTFYPYQFRNVFLFPMHLLFFSFISFSSTSIFLYLLLLISSFVFPFSCLSPFRISPSFNLTLYCISFSILHVFRRHLFYLLCASFQQRRWLQFSSQYVSNANIFNRDSFLLVSVTEREANIDAYLPFIFRHRLLIK